MAGKLAAFVTVHDPQAGRDVTYGPDDEVPAEHAALITNEKAWADAPPKAPAAPKK